MPSLIRQVVDSITHLGVVKDPVLVAHDTRSVLDGTHRVASLLQLDVDLTPCCLVDYSDRRVDVYRWFRTFPAKDPLGTLTEGREVVSASREAAEGMLLTGEGNVAMATREETHVFLDGGDPIGSSWSASDIESRFRRHGVTASYETERDAFDKLDNGEADLVLMYRPISKEDVIQSSRSGRLFAHKSTRHVIPARPLGFNTSLDILRAEEGREDSRNRFKSIIHGKKIVDLGSDCVVEGRRYEETVYWFGEDS
jgi:hypothetical protein